MCIRDSGADDEEWAFRVLQCMGQQRVEGLARGVVGKGEQLLELVDDEEEGGFIGTLLAQREGQRPLVLFQPLQPAEGVAPGGVGDEAALEHFGEFLDGLAAGHHRD